jgi:hypothetical protein
MGRLHVAGLSTVSFSLQSSGRGRALWKGKKMDTKPVKPDRSKINLEQPHELKYWKHALDVPEEQILAAIEKVGNSAAAVRKELGIMGDKH